MTTVLVLVVLVAAAAILVGLVWLGDAADTWAWQRAVRRREQLRAQVELQHTAHQAMLRMLQAARDQQSGQR